MRIIFLSIVLFSVCQVGICQIERPNKAYGKFKAEVTGLNSVNYKYEYVIENSEESEQVLVSFSINIKDRSFYGKTIPSPPNKKWYIDGLGKVYITGAAAGRALSLPPENGLEPGEAMEISFVSKGLPAINPFYTEGFVRPFTRELIDSLFKAGYTEDEIFIDWKEAAYKGYTISPRVWADSVDLKTFLNKLKSYRSRSCNEFEWVNTVAVCNDLQDQLQEVSTHFAAGDSLLAANAVTDFIEIIKANRSANMTTEGYGLFYYNARYLLQRLGNYP
ncbi:hypothetical protein [Fodinibius halophilus]|uniref:Uncharacterized protein n=1 Tax=Fodinibius halophilus TaxID=1736908 RepID=A0A6M1SZ46_9BACT|nr:hypothetical protein [Fodinibius halophilus]NGP89158.1 hypothetical protein [Fodinibius halophilus]